MFVEEGEASAKWEENYRNKHQGKGSEISKRCTP